MMGTNRDPGPNFGGDYPIGSTGQLVLECFACLEREGIEYRILHGYDSLPDEPRSDIDFAVSRGDLRRVTETLARESRSGRFALVQMIEHERTGRYHIIAASSPGRPILIRLDACSDYLREGHRWIPAEDLMFGGRRRRGIWIAEPSVTFGCYLLKKLLKGRIDDLSVDQLASCMVEDPEACRVWLRRWLPEAESLECWNAIERRDYGAVRAFVAAAGSRVVLRRAMRNPAAWLWGAARDMKRVVSRVIHRTGLFVAVLGPDGVGKSSLIRRLPSLVEDAFRSVRGLHLRPAVLPLRRHDPEDATHPHESPPYGSAKTVAKLVYLLVDYVVGYAIGVWPSLVRSTLVLADRYVDDIAVDPRRYRLSEITPLLRLIRRVCPSPDLEMVLFAPPHVLLDRKQEVTSDELRRLSERYRSLDTGRPDVVVIDATAPEGKVAEVAARAVLAFLAQRTAARIGP